MDFLLKMRGRRKNKLLDVSKNMRLDLFLQALLQDEEGIKSVEDLTFDTIKNKSLPQLRLNKAG